MTYEYTGYESALVPTSPENSNSPNTERKTEKSEKTGNTDSKNTSKQEQFVSSGGKNVLSSYRSYSYMFTLAAISKNDVKNPAAFKKSELDLVILKTGGKGKEGIANPTPEQVQTAQGNYKTAVDKNSSPAAKDRQKGKLENLQAIQGFNSDSPGRFDMFIDDIEIETIMAFTKEGGTTQPTSLRFVVYEPYSINGFIEALHIASVKAGYPNYIQSSLLLKIEFIGYPDGEGLEDPVIVPKSSRYFLIKITGLEVEVTERGTRYNVTAIPFGDQAFGQPGKLKKSVKLVGKNVRELLKDLADNLTEQEIQNAKKSGTPKFYDEYKIIFLKQSGNAWVDDSYGKIAESKLAELGVDNAIVQMVDPAENKRKNNYKIAEERKQETDAVKEEIPFEPKQTVTQFPENVNIHEVIGTVIRDSEYVSKIVEDIPIDEDGMVEYFNIRVEIGNKSEINPKTKKPNQIYTYIISPFRIHFTAIPNTENVKISEKKLKRSTLREYNYIYTGLNTEVINFRLNFNSLYFEALPVDMGQKDEPGKKNAGRPGNQTVRQVKVNPPSSVSSVPEAAQRTDPSATQVLPPSGYNAGAPKNDPYSVLARSMHEKVINSVSLLSGELEIIGDPFYLVTGGIGNYTPSMTSHLETADGEAAHIRGQVLIAINFRNPIDIKSFEEGGMMYFDSNRIPFSGVYQVVNVKNYFKDGKFNQKLNVMRVPGQIIDQNLEPQDPRDFQQDVPDPKDRVKEGETQALDFGQRLDSITLEEQFGRGIASPGLPGEDVNYNNTPGGLGGNNPSLKNQSSGAFPFLGSLQSKSTQIGLPLPTDFSRNIRISQLGLASLSQMSLENSSKVKSTIDTLFASKDLKNYSSLAGDLINIDLSQSRRVRLPNSGIGEEATNLVEQDELTLDTDAISFTSGLTENISQHKITSVSMLSNRGNSNVVNNLNDKVSSLLGSVSDPKALGSRVNLDVNKVSGLGGNLSSRLNNQISQFENVPDNVDLTEDVRRGLRLEYASAQDLKNIPPTQPLTAAPPLDVNMSYVNSVVSKQGSQGLANLYGVSNVKNISNSLLSKQNISDALENIPAGLYNPMKDFRKDVNPTDVNFNSSRSLSGKTQLNQLVGSTFIRDQGLTQSVTGKFGSKTLGKNPLDKLVNNVGTTNVSYNGDDPIIRQNLGLPPL